MPLVLEAPHVPVEPPTEIVPPGTLTARSVSFRLYSLKVSRTDERTG